MAVQSNSAQEGAMTTSQTINLYFKVLSKAARLQNASEADLYELTDAIRKSKGIIVDVEIRHESVHSMLTSAAPVLYAVVACYALLFCVSLSGNVYVLHLVRRLWHPPTTVTPAAALHHTSPVGSARSSKCKQAKEKLLKKSRAASSQHNKLSNASVRGATRMRQSSTVVYVLALVAVDLASTASILPTIVDQLTGAWLFGSLACKANMLLEWIGKTMNAFVLLAMALERCAAVRWTHRPVLRTRHFAVRTLSVAGALTLALLAPIVVDSHVVPLHLFRTVTPERRDWADRGEGLALVLTYHHQDKCQLGLRQQHILPYVSMLCLVCFVLPFTFATYLYSVMLLALREHHRQNGISSRIPLRQICLQCVATAGFYFGCFCPYWLLTVTAAWHMTNTGTKQDSSGAPPSAGWVYAMYCMHMLPVFVNSTNWIFYGAMNRQINQSYCDNNNGQTARRRRGGHQPTTNGHITRSLSMPAAVPVPAHVGVRPPLLLHSRTMIGLLGGVVQPQQAMSACSEVVAVASPSSGHDTTDYRSAVGEHSHMTPVFASKHYRLTAPVVAGRPRRLVTASQSDARARKEAMRLVSVKHRRYNSMVRRGSGSREPIVGSHHEPILGSREHIFESTVTAM